MKILFITDNFLPHIGGSRIVYYNLVTHMPKGSVVVLTKKVRGWKEFDQMQDFKIKRICLQALPWKWIKVDEFPIYASLFINGLCMALKERIDIIHCGELLPTGLVGLALSRLLGKPYIVYSHAEDVMITARFGSEARAMRLVLKKAGRVITTCSYVKEMIGGFGVDAHKVITVFPGVDDIFLRDGLGDERSVTESKKKMGLEEKRVLFTLARLIKRKGIDMVIEALPRVIEKVPNLVYLIAGEGPEAEHLKEHADRKGLQKYVRFLGTIRFEELPLYYTACDAFIQPSRELSDGDTEGFGIVFAEANAFGKPVIGGTSGGTADSIVDGVTGLRVDGGNVEKIAHAILAVLTDDGYARRLGEAGRERVRREFRWKEKADRVWEISREAVDRFSVTDKDVP